MPTGPHLSRRKRLTKDFGACSQQAPLAPDADGKVEHGLIASADGQLPNVHCVTQRLLRLPAVLTLDSENLVQLRDDARMDILLRAEALPRTRALAFALAAASIFGCSAGPNAPRIAAPRSSAEGTPSSATAPSDTSSIIRSVVTAPDREAADRALDAGRRPAQLLAFLGLAPGMRVAEICAGTGYTTELLARAVGDGGKVYGQNSRFVLEKFAAKGWAERLGKPGNENVVRVDRELDEPLPPEARELDAVVNVLFYHDTVWMKTDRAKMNANIFAALKRGGVYVIVDHSGRAGTGTSDTKTLHRIDEKVVREEALSAGFSFAGESDFLRNPKDARDWNASPSAAGARRGESDRFALKFVKR